MRNAGAVHGPASPYYQVRGSTSQSYFDEPASPLFPFGHGLSYATFEYSKVTLTPDANETIFTPTSQFTVSGVVASKGPATPLSLLLFFSQNAPTKYAQFNINLLGFTKITLPENSPGTEFSITANIRDMDSFEPSTGDYEVYTGTYTVTLATDAASTPLASWTLNVQGSYSWVWDFSK